MEKQLLGSEAPNTKNSPLSYTQEGGPLRGVEGDHGMAPLDYSPQENYTHPSSHRMNFESALNNKQEATMAPLNHTPQKGWNSMSTPMSRRAEEQSK